MQLLFIISSSRLNGKPVYSFLVNLMLRVIHSRLFIGHIALAGKHWQLGPTLQIFGWVNKGTFRQNEVGWSSQQQSAKWEDYEH